MNLSAEDRAVLAHVVADPDVWVANALTLENGEQIVTDKITKYRQAYLDALAAEGQGYKTKAQRDAVEAAALSAGQVERTALRQQLVTLAQSAVGVALDQLTAAQRNALIACLLFRAGGVTNDMKVKPLSEWLR